ncbi:hypothetical protein [Streptomyces olivaceus]|uniref:hypothetical protein n=1 Tax=Streptomyces olivaceus TaxID=47716 RepID=UPI0022EE2BA1|nr:hypothetical protein TPA0905_19190 [Streptomyces olivaceus]
MLREQERQQGPAPVQTAQRAVSRSTSPTGSGAATPASREMLALQGLAGNAGTTRLLAQRRSGTPHPVQRAVGRGGGAANRVVQRMPWPDPAAAHRRMLEQGWQATEDGGYTRAPQPETGESAGGQQAGAAPQTQGREQEQEQAADEPITLRVLVRKNASFRDEDYLNNVGHSWVAFYKGDKFQSSAGFYPIGGQINEDAPHRSVPGEVRMNHDDPSNATTELSVPLDQKQFSKAQKYIQTNLNHEYNVVRFNCTDFVIGVHKAATGHSPPGRNLLLPNNPNDLHSGIKKKNNKDLQRK